MSYARLPYDEPATPAEMAGDCRVVGTVLEVPRQLGRVVRGAAEILPPAPAPVRRATVAVSDAAASLAARFSD